uniref:FAD dependent oxidoreductase domain-containing protein n=1 Tax=Brassica campestris TaxID=3711 RepID=M4F8S4_BRACM
MVSIYVQSPTFLNSPFSSPASRRLPRGASSPQSLRVTASRSYSFDVVVVGGGIIGLTIARQFLTGSDLSVAVVDKAVPCSGATGAGSLLVGKTSQECVALKQKVNELSEGGLRAEYLSSADLFLKEPAILVDDETGAAFLPDDSQLDAHRAVAYIEKGHLLVVENFDWFHLNHGIMEAGYADHQSASAPGVEERMLSISMTATMDTTGNLVLGSSREFVGFDTEADETIIRCIWERAAEFFPTLRDISLEDFIRNRKVRVGLRPYMPDGKPMIGSVPGLQNLYLAAGHEGGGLSMALGTAEMVSDIVLGKPSKVDVSAFQVKGRPLPPILPHEVHFGKGTIDLGGLEVKQVSISNTTAKRVWRTYEGGRDSMGFSIFEPINLPANFFKIGFYAQPNNQKLFGWILVARDVSGRSLRPPVDYIEVWNTASLDIKQDGHAYFWQPVCLKGYKPVGVIVTTSSQKPPMKKKSISCVRSELTEQSEADTLVWGFKGVSVVNLRPVQRGTQATGVYTGTFSFQQLNSSPLPYLFCLKNTKLNMSSNIPSKAQTRALFKTYSPLIYFHPKENFLPSSVHWFFANGALLYKKGNESNPIPIQPNGTNLPQGGSNDNLFWLDFPLDKTAKEKVQRGDLRNTKVYLNIKPMFGGTFTDIAVWIFCPFNGNAHLKFLFIKSLSLGQIGEHVGDWEHVTLRISNFNGKLWRVYFSQHSGGTLVDACDLEYVEGANKPVIYSSLHGHAMFSKPGLVLQGKRKYGIRNDMARSDKWLDCGKG